MICIKRYGKNKYFLSVNLTFFPPYNFVSLQYFVSIARTYIIAIKAKAVQGRQAFSGGCSAMFLIFAPSRVSVTLCTEIFSQKALRGIYAAEGSAMTIPPTPNLHV